MPDQLVITPGGYRPSSQVHLVEPGNVIDGSAGTLRKLDPTGKVVADYGALPQRPAGTPLMPGNVLRLNDALARYKGLTLGAPAAGAGGAAGVAQFSSSPQAAPGTTVAAAVTPGLGTGWIVFAYWNNDSGQHITSFKTTWVVPPAPEAQDGQLIFLFNGIQNSTMIYQPVLQWGVNSAAGGGYSWAVASWYADGQGGPAFYTKLAPVSVGQTLTGVMTLTGQANGKFSYSCSFEGIADTTLPIQNVEELTWCAETLEAYGLQHDFDYPLTCKTAMSAIEIKVGSSEASLSWTAVNSVTDVGQHAVVVSNASPGGEVDLFYTNGAPLIDKTIITSNTTPKSPAIASLGGRIYIAWKGDGNDYLNVMFSSDGGRTFNPSTKYISKETSPVAPSLCVHNDSLYIAWKGDGNDYLNVALVESSATAVTGFVKRPPITSNTTPLTPAIASYGGNLYIAWKGDGNDYLNLMYSTNNGETWATSAKYVSKETSPQAPSLCVHNNNLYIAWKGDGNDYLNVAMVDFSGAAATGLTKTIITSNTSQLTPAITSANGRLYIAWKGDGNDWLNVMYSTDDGKSFGNKFTSAETSPQAPGLCTMGTTAFITWKGDGNDYLNVAQVCACS